MAAEAPRALGIQQVKDKMRAFDGVRGPGSVRELNVQTKKEIASARREEGEEPS
jgi:hypothetical protein